MSIRPEKRVWDKTWGQDSKKVQISHTDKMILNYLIKEINPKDSDIIEMGCGRGVLSYMISKYNPNTITLMDFSKEALARAKNLFQDIQNVHYMDGDLLNIKTDKKYDIVFSSGVVEHFSSKLRKKAIENHFEVSKDKVAIIVPAKPHYNTIRHKKIQSLGCRKHFPKVN